MGFPVKPGAVSGLGDFNLTNGEEFLPRPLVTGATVLTSGQMRFLYHKIRKGGTYSQIAMITGSTAAAATPTLCRMGLYLLNPDNSLTLIAATANDTTLFSVVTTIYTRSFTAPVTLSKGTVVAASPLVVSAVAMPNLIGIAGAFTATGLFQMAPVVGEVISGQADLPNSLAPGARTPSAVMNEVILLP